jgi:3-methyl-2-oxobutanoate hydroxymethyltransferase
MSAERLARLSALYQRGEPIVMLTAYDFPSARIAAAGGVDVILVGDSGAMTVLGYPSTRDISLDELLTLTKAARRGAPDIALIGDMPYGTYEESDAQAVATAHRFASEGGCDAVKLEGAGGMVSRVKAIIASGIPVYGHVGLLPQSVRTREGYRARGRDPAQAIAIVHDAQELDRAGISALIVEAVPAAVTKLIVDRVRVPVIGIGAGSAAGQVLVYHDLLGFSDGRLARFVKQYASANADLSEAVSEWVADVRSGRYPAAEHTYPITPEALSAVQLTLDGE